MRSKSWIQKGCVLVVLSSICSGLMFGLFQFFPQVDRRAVDWQLRHSGDVPLDDSLVLISTKEGSQLFL